MVALAEVWAAALLLLAELSVASPVVSFPINSQVPPVARIGEPLSFVFSPTTFTSNSPITYSLANAPKWLSIDSSSRRLFGTPGPGDAGPGRVTGVPLELVASDGSGSTSMAATLVVVRGQGLKVDIPLEKQPPDFGIFSAPSSVLADPEKDFSFRIDPKTFSATSGSPTYYYATMADNTPLPAWILFDSASLSFSGRTPSMEALIQPPQRFSFQLVASDVAGFAGAALEFDIIVGNHQLDADATTVVLNATPGILLSYTGLANAVKVDGKPAAPGSVVVASAPNIPSWLSLDKHTLHLAGVPPASATSTSFTVSLRNNKGNTIDVTVRIQMPGDKGSLFTARTPKLAITPGESFAFNLRPYLTDPGNTDVSIEAPSARSWMKFSPGTFTLSGVAPAELKEPAVDVNIIARSRTSKETASLSFPIAIRAGHGRGGDQISSGISGTQANGSSDDEQSPEGESGRRFNPVLLAVLLPLLLLLALAVFVLFWCFRRRKDREKRSRSIRARDISGPIPGSFVASSPSPGFANALPDFAKRFGKSFSADDVFGSKKPQIEVRNASLTQADIISQPKAAMRPLRPGTTGPLHDTSTPPEKANRNTAAPPFIPPPPPTLLTSLSSRTGRRPKVSASLSSITETSIGDFVDTGELDRDAKRSFRDRLELNVPTLWPPEGCATYPAAPSPVGADARPGSSRTAPDMESVRSGERFFSPPMSGRRAWGWLRGVKGKPFGRPNAGVAGCDVVGGSDPARWRTGDGGFGVVVPSAAAISGASDPDHAAVDGQPARHTRKCSGRRSGSNSITTSGSERPGIRLNNHRTYSTSTNHNSNSISTTSTTSIIIINIHPSTSH
ncbi:hypothetical protein VTJ49DRAFT_5575 [Mycothermus thermophilus]|uniref:Dystroglycan-type cadherin-like domain-containing protein n=1 Tax=Humicola insolens TaxID=85995 RepID=A0ABR3V2Z2_HUMIN